MKPNQISDNAQSSANDAARAQVVDRLVALANKKNITMKDLSFRLGRNHAYLNQFIERGYPWELKLEDRIFLTGVLGCSLEDLSVDKSRSRSMGPSVSAMKKMPLRLTAHEGEIPILGRVSNGCLRLVSAGKDVVVRPTPRPVVLAGVTDAYAVYMPDESMQPAIREGWLLYINPERVARSPNHVLIRMKDGTAIVRNFIQRKKSGIWVQSFNPSRQYIIPTDDIASVDVIAALTCTAR